MLIKYKVVAANGDVEYGVVRLQAGQYVCIDGLSEVILTPFMQYSVKPINPPYAWRGNTLAVKEGGVAKVGEYLVKIKSGTIIVYKEENG